MAEGRGRGPGRCLGEELEGLPAGWLEERQRRGVAANGKDRGGGGDTWRGRRGGAGRGGRSPAGRPVLGHHPRPEAGRAVSLQPPRPGRDRAERRAAGPGGDGAWRGPRRAREETGGGLGGQQDAPAGGGAERQDRGDPAAGRGGISPPVNQKPGRRGNCLPCLGREREGSQEEKKQVRRGGRSHCAVHTAETGTTL